MLDVVIRPVYNLRQYKKVAQINNRKTEKQRLNPDVEFIETWDYEEEVPPCERGAKDFPSPERRGARGEV